MKTFDQILNEGGLFRFKFDIKKIVNDLKKNKLLTGPIIGSVAYAYLSDDFGIAIGDIDILGDIPKDVKSLPENIEKGYITWVYHLPNDKGAIQFEYVKIMKFKFGNIKLKNKPVKINGIQVINPKDWVEYELKRDNSNKERIQTIIDKYNI